jgi:hypothetical protein
MLNTCPRQVPDRARTPTADLYARGGKHPDEGTPGCSLQCIRLLIRRGLIQYNPEGSRAPLERLLIVRKGLDRTTTRESSSALWWSKGRLRQYVGPRSLLRPLVDFTAEGDAEPLAAMRTSATRKSG